jgi:hypothetical protein
MNHIALHTQAHPSGSVSTICHCYTLSVSVVSLGEDGMISLGGHGQNGGPNLIGNAYAMGTSSFITIPKNAPPQSSPMMISVKECIYCGSVVG